MWGFAVTEHAWFATCPKGLESLLNDELVTLGAENTRQTVAGVYFDGPLEAAYRVCLWSRLASRVLMPLARFDADSQEALYEGARAVPWEEHLAPTGSLLVDFSGTSGALRNTQFSAVRIKDAVVDRLRELTGERPGVSKTPDLRINARLSKGRVALSIDLSGDSLHRRGYRGRQGEAPLKENLAAAILLRAGWPAIAAEGGALLDPMCGSGTLLIEAALMAADMAPALRREHFGFSGWLGHVPALWQSLRDEAVARKNAGLAKPLPEIRGYDGDLRAVRAAEENIIAAGLDHWLRVRRKELSAFTPPTHARIRPGLIVTNPPYGERLGETESLKLLYAHLGQRLRDEFQGWQLALFTGNPELGKQMGLRAHRKYKLFNGTIASELLLFTVDARSEVHDPSREDTDNPWRNAVIKGSAAPSETAPPELTEGARMLINRLRKNQKSLARWVKQNNVSCYRLYDADMPEYAAAIDLYRGYVAGKSAGQGEAQVYALVQEYAAPKTVDEARARERFAEIQAAVPEALDIPPSRISYRQRRRNKGKMQYEKLAEQPAGDLLVVEEGGARLQVNLWQYLDSGLFLDHRPVRDWIAGHAENKRFLNLFCYTASASVRAALAGARLTVSVDMSNTYLDWARRNLALNGLSEARNRLEQADCLTWLADNSRQFDLILLDPPSFSNSKKMEGVLDIQRDHVALIQGAMKALSEEGTLIFSTNLRSFKLDAAALSAYTLEDITAATLDPDFKRNAKIHRCWLIRH